MRYRCPYCKRELPPPPWESACCPRCRKTMRLPSYLAGGGADPRAARRKRENIRREAERARLEMGFTPDKRLGRQPALMLVALLVLFFLGGSLISLSRKTTRVPPARRAEIAGNELAALAQALALYKHHVGRYPEESDGALVALVADPGHPGWMGPYINHILPDPWNRPYFYNPAESPPTLFSAGPDRAPGSPDDIYAQSDDFVLSSRTIDEWRLPETRSPTVEIYTQQTQGKP